MATEQSFKDLCKYIALTLMAIVATVWFYPGPGLQGTKFGFVLGLAFAIIPQAWERFLVWRLSDSKYLEKTANDLWHAHSLKQFYAIYRIGLVVGARFGNPPFWNDRHHATRCELWRTWWERHADNLVWDRELAAYVEETSPVDE